VAARLQLRVAQPDEVVDWAMAERVGGTTGAFLDRLPELRSTLDLEQAARYFERAAQEADYELPQAKDALKAYARQLADAILLEAIDPHQACGLLCRIWLELGQPDSLSPWGYLDDGLSADGSETLSPDAVLTQIREQANLLARQG
jgi:hypothetical protein